MSELTDDERETLMSAVIAKMVNREVQVVPVVESIKAAAYRAGQVAALEDAADEQDRLSTGPRAMGSKAVQFKRIIFANWLRARAAELRETP